MLNFDFYFEYLIQFPIFLFEFDWSCLYLEILKLRYLTDRLNTNFRNYALLLYSSWRRLFACSAMDLQQKCSVWGLQKLLKALRSRVLLKGLRDRSLPDVWINFKVERSFNAISIPLRYPSPDSHSRSQFVQQIQLIEQTRRIFIENSSLAILRDPLSFCVRVALRYFVKLIKIAKHEHKSVGKFRKS